jgi:hypothetical protein
MLHHMGGTAFAFRIGTHEEVQKPPENFPHSCGVFNYKADKESFGHHSSLSFLTVVVLMTFYILALIL